MTRTKQKQKKVAAEQTAARKEKKQVSPARESEIKQEVKEEEAPTIAAGDAGRKDTTSGDLANETVADKKSQTIPLSPAEEAAATIANQEKQIVELNDRLLRKIAEFDNYRKRTLREQINLLESASGPLMLKLLPALDDMEQLEKLAPEQATAETLLKGLTLIHKKVNDILRKEGLEPIPAAGEPFDPELHEVLAVMEDNEQKPGVILVEQQKGYRLKGRILRHSRVVINKEEE